MQAPRALVLIDRSHSAPINPTSFERHFGALQTQALVLSRLTSSTTRQTSQIESWLVLISRRADTIASHSTNRSCSSACAAGFRLVPGLLSHGGLSAHPTPIRQTDASVLGLECPLVVGDGTRTRGSFYLSRCGRRSCKSEKPLCRK